ncbi:hypothetical protein FEE95_11825 [Maribacter algarum]|uniref:Uncharacterized protein n=1 Tax=Maribacter algarum (ex Zhang et al. 2020) TaxID=2578118 RepID=A0A5S3PTD3_9FLAO|nr:hypothetical protein [Maribacter algarum]TMM57173.1 hypothetical protein FEE95_11825 [Maribacter algarum]
MNKYISLIIGILAVANLIYGFIVNQTQAAIFGMEVDIWTYRAVWAAIAVYSFYDFYRKNRLGNS